MEIVISNAIELKSFLIEHRELTIDQSILILEGFAGVPIYMQSPATKEQIIDFIDGCNWGVGKSEVPLFLN
ncbi:hypothetical protein RYH73_03420 [Olivibacter sp. CPCC 100613]|uniref:hypothetical protein n=1 Tax=Olivibacter sp. CPCC 100613 TaxID=3079931 RepID=UPI002FF5D698